jgi:hypothetical protein
MDFADLGVLINTHSGHRQFLKPSLLSCRQMRPAQLVVAYNTIIDSAYNYPLDEVMPAYDTFALADMWLITEFGQRVNSWLWLQQFGLRLLSKGGKDTPPPKYVFSMEGDCIITKSKGIHLIENGLVADATDIICCELRDDGNHAGAVSYFAKMDAIMPVIDLMVRDAYKRDDEQGKAYGNIESRFGRAIKQCGLKCSFVHNPEHEQFSYGYRGTWGDHLGFKHLHGMEKWRMSVHHRPLPREYYDTRYLRGSDLAALEYFWQTNDVSKLQEMGYWSEATPEQIEMGLKYAEAI